MVTKGFKKKKSKRVSSKQIRKVDKKVKEHNRKQKREAKKNPAKRKASKKDPGIPNSFPFKEELLNELAEKKRKDFDKKKQRKLDKKSDAKKKRTLDSIVHDAQKRSAAFERKSPETNFDAKELDQLYDSSLKAYYKEVKKVIEAADVILEVLDARDPLGTRCQQLENAVLQAGPNKRLVLVLNKCDLIPKTNLLAWLRYLRQELPTIPFKASTQNQRSHLSHCRVPVHLAKPDLIKTSKCFGVSMLMKILGNYCRNKGLISTSIRVGIVGLPNVGKSSIINSLKRKQSCTVGATPGVTKTMQEVHLDKHITLLDSPGVLFAKEGDTALVALRNAVKVDAIADPVQPVEIILKKCSKVQLMLHYKISDFDDGLQFLALVALKRGFLKKGGIPDVTKVARTILQDWVGGKISYHTLPPEKHIKNIHLSAELVTTMSKEFDLDNLEEDDQMLVDEMPETDESRTTAIEELGDEDETMKDVPATASGAVQIVDFPGSAKDDPDSEWMSDDSTKALEGNQQWSKQKKKYLKRRLKLKTKRDKTSSAMANQMDSILNFGAITDMMEE